MGSLTMSKLNGSRILDRDRVGGKAWSINFIRSLGLAAPPAFVLPTDFCTAYLHTKALPAEAMAALAEGVSWLESELGRTFGGTTNPLLVSVRSGAAQSMPGMMDTILNLGVTTAAERHYGTDVATRFRAQFTQVVGAPPPADPWQQLYGAVGAVFGSWLSDRAVTYRNHHGLPHDTGTAVTIQGMVFGNIGTDGGTGVLFTRNPLTGDNVPLGEWLRSGQGDDVVSGRFDPQDISVLSRDQPEVHAELMAAAGLLEREARDVQDIEFAVENGGVWLLQTRAAKRSASAAIRIAVAMHRDGVISEVEALGRVTAAQVDAVLRPHIDPSTRGTAEVLVTGLPACPGVASGRVVHDSEAAQDADEAGEEVILARPTTDPDDIHGMIAARAVLTELGGSTSHAAVVSREIDKPCVVGCGQGALSALAGREVTVDGSTGEVFSGRLAIVDGEADDDLKSLRHWAISFADAGAHLEFALSEVPDPQVFTIDAVRVDEADLAVTSVELAVLQIVRMKGRVSYDDLYAAARVDGGRVDHETGRLLESGLLQEKKAGQLSLAPAGKSRLIDLLAEERAAVKADGLEILHERFLTLNTEFKVLVNHWQQRDGSPNDHSDSDYDESILKRLRAVDSSLNALLSEIVAEVPRLSPFEVRFGDALDRVGAGDVKWFLNPMCDSYHTVWFELHEELIALTGRTRQAEAAAGNAL